MKNLLSKSSGLLVILLILSFSLMAQFGQRMPKSPEINPDNSVTFRLLAKSATKVGLTGNWMPGYGTVVDMKSDTGLWTITVDPLPSEMYTYVFVVDGVRAIDPGNAVTVRDGTRNESMFIVPGDKASLYATQEVPHGTLEKVWYSSPTLGLERLLYVYTPAGYRDSKSGYPVLYLLHGAGGDEDAWTTLGRTPQILDNVIAAGKAKPMIVVMTNGNPGQAAAPGVAPVKAAAANQNPMAMGQGKFEESLVKDVVPFIEKNYRVIANKDNRSVSGLSMGGMQTMNIANKYPEVFSYYGVMSMGLMDMSRFGGKDDPAARLQSLKNLQKSGVKLYWIGCGKEDFLYQSVTDLRKFLDDNKFPYQYLETSGGHTWPNWRIYLSELTPKLFK
jgi:enterochelin esterase-like enzyme